MPDAVIENPILNAHAYVIGAVVIHHYGDEVMKTYEVAPCGVSGRSAEAHGAAAARA